MILDLVDYRNDANHGHPDVIVSLDALHDWLEFVLAFCRALASIILHRMTIAYVEKNEESILGKLTERFSNNVVVVTCDRGEFEVGENLCFLRDKDCSVVEILSIQLNGVARQSVKVDSAGTEIGLKISGPVGNNTRVLKCPSA